MTKAERRAFARELGRAGGRKRAENARRDPIKAARVVEIAYLANAAKAAKRRAAAVLKESA